MATKKCPNGHQYDSSIYGDNCPFCPDSSHTHVNEDHTHVNDMGGETQKTYADNLGGGQATGGTIPLQENIGGGGGHTVIRNLNGDTGMSNPDGGRKVVGVLVSYSANPAGEVFKIYEGRNLIGRAPSSDIVFSKDDKMSGTHLLILYREAEGIFWAVDQNSSNGTYINGKFASDRVELHANDVIVLGATKMIFFSIPSF